MPQQSGMLGDCGVWVCILLERKIKREELYRTQENTTTSVMEFRLRLGRLVLETKFKEEQKKQGDSRLD